MEPQAAALLACLAIVVLFIILKLKREPSDLGAGKGKSTKTVVDVEAEADSKPVVRILYGTQTGTAERFSKSLGTELRRKYGDSTTVEVMDVENYKGEQRLAKERLVLFLMATYGDGEPTDNAADFYSWITAEAEAVENGEKEAYMQVRGRWEQRAWGCGGSARRANGGATGAGGAAALQPRHGLRKSNSRAAWWGAGGCCQAAVCICEVAPAHCRAISLYMAEG